MGQHLNRRHPVSGALFTDLRARACAMRAEHASVREIAKALGVSRSCAHRWVLEAPEHAAATARNGGVRIYPREQRIAMAREVVVAEGLDTVGGITRPAAAVPPPPAPPSCG